MMKNKLVFLLSASTFLIGCNKNIVDFKVITDEAKIIETANSIIVNQDSSSFGSLDNFIIKNTHKITRDESLPTQRTQSSKVTTNEFTCDLKNYLIKDKTNETTLTSKTNLETIYYYDKNVRSFYILTNKNDFKTKTVQTEVSIDNANAQLKSVCSKYITEIKNRKFLNTINSVIAKLKATKEEYKDKTDEYYNYTFGSNDTKSIQLKTESKDKYYDSDLEGYITISENNMMSDNKENYYLKRSKINAKDKNNISYMNNLDEQNITYSYNNAFISTPNINEYK